MDALILLPVRPHIAKYLTCQYGHTIFVYGRGTVPFLLQNMFKKFDKEDPGKIKPSQRLIDGVKFVGYRVHLSETFFKYKGAYLSIDDILNFNNAIDDLLKNEMYNLIKKSLTPGLDPKFEVDLGIKRFRDIYDISEDELSFDNLKRWYYRNRQRIENRLSYAPAVEPQLVLAF